MVQKSKYVSLLLIVMLVIGTMLSGCSKPAAAPATGDQKAPANQKAPEYILLGRVNPTTGPLAGFGNGTPAIEQAVIDQVNKDGGIFIKEYNKKIPLKLIVADSESDPTKASEAATKLVLQDKVNLLLTAHTPDTTVPASAVGERYKVPTISVETPSDVWLTGGPYKYAFHTGFLVGTMNETFLDMWDTMNTNKKVGFLYGTDPDGTLFSADMKPRAEKRGYTIVDPGRFTQGAKDYTTMINQYKKENVDIVVAEMITPDFASAWKQMHQQGFVPKIMAIGKAVLFPADAESLGPELGDGLISEIWWSGAHPYKSSITGQSAAEFTKWWTDTTKKQSSAVLGYKHAAIEIAVDVLKRAQTLDKEVLRETLKSTNMDTIIGHIQFNDKNYCETKLVGGQWVKGKDWPYEMKILSNKQAPMVPVTGEKMFPVPGSK